MGRRAKLPTLFFAVFALAPALPGCSSVVLVRKPEARVLSEPAYTKRQQFYFWGLVEGENDIFLDKVCLKKEADQVVTEWTAGNSLEWIFTLGISTPRTVKVWCSL